MIYFNPIDKFYKSVTGAVEENTPVIFRVKGNFNSVLFVFENDKTKQKYNFICEKINDYFQCEVNLPIGLYWYNIIVDNSNFISFNAETYDGVLTDKAISFQYSVYSKGYVTPDWIKGGVIYQIFPDRFCSSGKTLANTDRYIHSNKEDSPIFEPNEHGKVLNNDFFGGDFEGIISKLDYLSELGVTVIYLNPIFEANSNHRYDTGDYMQIDPLLGDETDFKNLIIKAEEYGIKIVLDGVFNHTGDDSLYFNKYGNYDSVGAYQSVNSPYKNWFNFKCFPNEYESWWGIDILPSTNKTNNEFLDFITGKDGVLEYYTKMGIGGWRLDVVDELPARFVRAIRSAVKGINSDAIVIGEVWEDASNKISYGDRREYFLGKELDSVMNYPLKDAIISFVNGQGVSYLNYVVRSQIDRYPKHVLNSLMNILSTHDTARALNVFAFNGNLNKSKKELSTISISQDLLEKAKNKLKIASLLQFTIYGVPSLYYGDEAGMQGFIDPFNRKFFPWGKEDQDLINWYKTLGQLRKDYSAFIDGEFVQIYSTDKCYVFARKSDNSEVLVGVNLDDSEVLLNYNGKLYSVLEDVEYVNEYVIKPQSCCVLIKR